MFQQQLRAISRLWVNYARQKHAGVVDLDLHNKCKGNSGRKGIDLESLRTALKEIPIKVQTTQRAVAAHSEFQRHHWWKT